MTETNDADPEAELPARRRFLLARLAGAIRRQEWFTVLVEIAVVVLGVVIGFQVTAWGQSRSDRAKERTYLRQIAADLRETERRLDAADARSAYPDLLPRRHFWAAERSPVLPRSRRAARCLDIRIND